MTLILRWRRPAPAILTRWRGPAGMAEAVRRDPAAPIAAIIGPPGASTGAIAREVAQDVLAGQAVRPNAQGRLVLARADSLAGAALVAVAATSAASGNACTVQRDFLILADWSAATGSAALTPGADYFLSAAVPGALTLIPPQDGVILRVGIALDPVTLALAPGLPIQL